MRELQFHLWDDKRKIMYYYEPTWGNYEHGNGWGDYDGFITFVRDYLEACEQYPDANVRVSR
jgi:hypothetical protein